MQRMGQKQGCPCHATQPTPSPHRYAKPRGVVPILHGCSGLLIPTQEQTTRASQSKEKAFLHQRHDDEKPKRKPRQSMARPHTAGLSWRSTNDLMLLDPTLAGMSLILLRACCVINYSRDDCSSPSNTTTRSPAPTSNPVTTQVPSTNAPFTRTPASPFGPSIT